MILYILIILLKLFELYFLTRKYYHRKNTNKQLILTSIILLIIVSFISDNGGTIQSIASIMLVIGLYISWNSLVLLQFWITIIWLFYSIIINRNISILPAIYQDFPTYQKGIKPYDLSHLKPNDRHYVVGQLKYPTYVKLKLEENMISIGECDYIAEERLYYQNRNSNRIELKIPDKIFFNGLYPIKKAQERPILLEYLSNDKNKHHTYIFIGENQQIYTFYSNSPIKYFTYFSQIPQHFNTENPDEYTYSIAITDDLKCYLLYDIDDKIRYIQLPFEPENQNDLKKVWNYIIHEDLYEYVYAEKTSF